MTLLNLSFVTRTLIALVDRRVQNSPAWPVGAPFSVLPAPPDMLTDENAIGLYLYHISEDAGYKNLPPPGNDRSPVRFAPMGLNLYYQLTARSSGQDNDARFREQLMMGLAMKAFHDFPIIDDSTEVNGSQVLFQDLRDNDNCLRISLLPVAQEQSVEYWTAGSRPMRLAAYYHVSMALLEPEDLERRAGRVLRYGVFAFASGSPRLLGSRNTLTFTVPGETSARTVELQPAQVPYGGQVEFFGNDLTGDLTSLVLHTANWDEPVEVGVDWNVTAAGERVFAVVQTAAGSEDVLPGVYTAAVRVRRTRVAPGGLSRQFASTSNATPFMVAPRIDTLSAPTPTGEVTVTGATFQHANLPEENVQVFAGEDRLERVAAAPLNPGQFTVVDAGRLDLRLPAGLVPGLLAPFRLIVNGAESPPNWIVVP